MLVKRHSTAQINVTAGAPLLTPLVRRPDVAGPALARLSKTSFFTSLPRFVGAAVGGLGLSFDEGPATGITESPAAGLRVSSRQGRALRQSLGLDRAAPWGSPFFGGSADEEPPKPLGMSALRDMLGVEYQGVASIGTTAGGTPQELKLIFDTGSSDFWVASDLCHGFPCVGPGRDVFDHTRSTTFRFPKNRIRLTSSFGSGQISGDLGVDEVRIGPLTLQGQGMGLIAEEIGQAFKEWPIEGLVGLGFPSIAAEPGTSLVHNLLHGSAREQSQLSRLQFAFYLHKDLARGGSILWGGHDARLHEGELQWFPVSDEQLYWSVDLVKFRVGTEEIAFPEQDERKLPRWRRPRNAVPRLIVDSGTTFYTASGPVFAAMTRHAQPTRCDQIHSLPTWVYTIRDVHGELQDFSIGPEEYMVNDEVHPGQCMPGILDLGAIRGRPAMILGELFMRRYFTVFSLDGSAKRATFRGRPELSPHIGLARARFGGVADAFFEEAAESQTSRAAS